MSKLRCAPGGCAPVGQRDSVAQRAFWPLLGVRRVCAMQDECYYPRALTVWPGIWPKARWPSWPAQGPTQATGWPAAAGQLSAGQLDGVCQHLRDSKTTKTTCFLVCAAVCAIYIYSWNDRFQFCMNLFLTLASGIFGVRRGMRHIYIYIYIFTYIYILFIYIYIIIWPNIYIITLTLIPERGFYGKA